MRPDDVTRKRELPFGSILREYRKKSKLSQKELADMMEVTRNTVINWEADKSKPDYNYIPDLCSILSIPLHELFSMKADAALSAMESRVINNFRQLNYPTQCGIDKMLSTMVDEELIARDTQFKENVKLFLVSPGAAAAGTGIETQEKPTYTFLRRNSVNEKADGIIKVSGKSMEPVYHNGDYVYYRNACCSLPGEDVIVDTDDGTVIKRTNIDGTLFSVNPNLPYPKKNEDNSLITRGVVLGKVYASDRLSNHDLSLAEELFADEVREFREENKQYAWE